MGSAFVLLSMFILINYESIMSCRSTPGAVVERCDHLAGSSLLPRQGSPWLFLASAYFLWVGFGLLAANRWARWVSIGVSSLLAAWMLFRTIIPDLLQGRVQFELGFQAVQTASAGLDRRLPPAPIGP